MPVVSPALIVISDIVPKSVPSVPVPPVPSIETVISSVATTELVAVSVNDDPAFSAILEPDDVRVIVGAFSSSTIIIVAS